MIIHNVMEDLVYDEVNKLFDEAEEKKESWLTCSCMQCRVDTMCYVLNRLKPRYIKSGRGLAHFLKFEKTEKTIILPTCERKLKILYTTLKRIIILTK